MLFFVSSFDCFKWKNSTFVFIGKLCNTVFMQWVAKKHFLKHSLNFEHDFDPAIPGKLWVSNSIDLFFQDCSIWKKKNVTTKFGTSWLVRSYSWNSNRDYWRAGHSNYKETDEENLFKYRDIFGSNIWQKRRLHIDGIFSPSNTKGDGQNIFMIPKWMFLNA